MAICLLKEKRCNPSSRNYKCYIGYQSFTEHGPYWVEPSTLLVIHFISICLPQVIEGREIEGLELPLDAILEHWFSNSIFVNGKVPLKYLQLRDLLAKIGTLIYHFL